MAMRLSVNALLVLLPMLILPTTTTAAQARRISRPLSALLSTPRRNTVRRGAKEKDGVVVTSQNVQPRNRRNLQAMRK
jgi:hypothetical protein